MRRAIACEMVFAPQFPEREHAESDNHLPADYRHCNADERILPRKICRFPLGQFYPAVQEAPCREAETHQQAPQHVLKFSLAQQVDATGGRGVARALDIEATAGDGLEIFRVSR